MKFQWSEREGIRQTPCSFCGADPGSPCTQGRSGREVGYPTYFHADRIKAYRGEPVSKRVQKTGPSDHDTLLAHTLTWCRGQDQQIILAELPAGRIIPDVLAFESPYRPTCTLFEVKVSRSDFHADRKKPLHKRPDEFPGQFRYYVTPPGLVTVEELPERWGLLEVGARSTRMVHRATAWTEDSVRVAALPYLALALVRHQQGVPWYSDRCRFKPVYGELP